MDRARLSLNQYTVRPWSLDAAIDACVRREIPSIAVWRDKLAEAGVAGAAARLRDAGLRVSSLCRGGFFPAPSANERARRVDDNRRAIEEAAAIGAPLLVLVCGPAEGQPLPEARAQVADGIAQVAADALAAGVRLGIEPLHPMMIAERSVIASLREANDLVERIGAPGVRVVCDLYHIFWDAHVESEIARAGATIAGCHVSDWTTPRGDVTADRAMLGEGCIDVAGLVGHVERAGYAGDIEIEILNATAWQGDLDAWLDRALERYLTIGPADACVQLDRCSPSIAKD
ncbi:MAG TPA: sugar phosphate isomerase/epimerase family protein [Candidatus Sulfotelmatobacter sp.]|nr:sugar phosphate isomerase/epimerase family protein [Candidatus Sulfotelmatobacter sp.]